MLVYTYRKLKEKFNGSGKGIIEIKSIVQVNK